jgi:hypothetical protein
MKKYILTLTVLVSLLTCSFCFADAKKDNYKKYSRVNNFLNTKFPLSKAAPDYYKR